MSSELKFKIRPFTIHSVCSIGYRNWYLKFHHPSQAFGMFFEIVLPWAHYEFRVNKDKHARNQLFKVY